MIDKDNPIVNLTTPLRLGNVHTPYNLMFDGQSADYMSIEHNNRNKIALEQILTVTPQVMDSLRHVRSDLNITVYPQQNDSQAVSEEMYEGEFTGSFNIPWLVIASIKGEELLVDYEARFKRPDSSLEFVLDHSKRPSLITDRSEGDVVCSPSLKFRTRIDGLLTWISLDEWEGARTDYWKRKPEALTLKHRGLEPQLFRVEDGQYATLEGVDSFVGTWYERWWTSGRGQGKSVNSFEVSLKGSWK